MGLFDDDRRAVTQDFGHALHEFGRIVSDADNRIGTLLLRVFDHKFIRLFAGLLTQAGEERDVAADKCLQRSADRPDYRPRAHDDAFRQAQILHDPLARYLKSCGCVFVVHGIILTGCRPKTNWGRVVVQVTEIFRKIDDATIYIPSFKHCYPTPALTISKK